MPEYAAAVFADARECFEEIVGWLSGAGAGGLDHGRLEQELGVRGREIQRLLYQAHLDLRAAREERREGVTGAGGVARTRVEKGRRRGLATVFGQVTVTRMAYRATWTRSSPTTPTTPFITPAGVQRGKDGIRAAFTQLLADVPSAAWELKTTIYVNDALFPEWAATAAATKVEDGIDTFIFSDGPIRVQTVRYTLQNTS